MKSLKDRAVVWYALTDHIDAGSLQDDLKLLSVAERDRYDSIRFDDDKHHYLVAHVLLRRCLSLYSDRSPSEWQFGTGEHGRPYAIDAEGIEFNLTHTDGLCACVLTYGRRCGIDAERHDRRADLIGLANRMFAPEERDTLLSSLDQQTTFYQLWTLREAYLKATGEGLSGSSSDFYFDLSGKDPRIVFRECDDEIDSGWEFYLPDTIPTHCMAVALEAESDKKAGIKLERMMFDH